MLKRRFRTILTARLLLEYREHLLFLQQTPRNGGGFTLPGGKVEGEEFAKEALVREAFEEVGVIVLPKHLKLVHITHRKVDSIVEVIFFFHCQHVWAGEPSVKEPEKFQNVVWLPLDEPPEKLTSVLTHALDAWKTGKIFSQFPKSRKKSEAKSSPSVTLNEVQLKKKLEINTIPIIGLNDIKLIKKVAKKVEKPLEKKLDTKIDTKIDTKELKKIDKKIDKKEVKTDEKKVTKKSIKKV
ncbi:MAG: NUDIX domain-containing protein [Saprospiraceae bacterium]|nr:NUDIX domain-containing protein [Saprospiraceae bacterium]